MALVLYEIPWSHFCEKARFCLDVKRLAYTRVAVGAIRRREIRAAGGRGPVPVLRDGERLVEGSAAIAAHVDELQPDPPLLPADAGQRADALSIQARCDAQLGPDARRLAYRAAIEHPMLLKGTILWNDAPKRWLNGLALPVLAWGLRRRFAITPDEVERSRARVRALLAGLQERLAGRNHLIGERLTLADIAAVSLMDPLEHVPEIVRDAALLPVFAWKRRTAAAHRRPCRTPWISGPPPPGMPA